MTNQEVERIKNQYVEKEATQLEQLKKLDCKAKLPGLLFGYIFGTISVLILGVGMCICLGAILKDYFYIGIIIGVVGLILVSINPLLTKIILKKGKAKYAPQILELCK